MKLTYVGLNELLNSKAIFLVNIPHLTYFHVVALNIKRPVSRLVNTFMSE